MTFAPYLPLPMAPPPEPRPRKPLLRGVSHQVAALVAIVGWFALVVNASGARARVAALVYGGCLVALFAASALYHRPDWSPGPYRWMRRIDHSAIYLLIAGTYTPICLLLADGRARWTLALVWVAAGLGVAMAMAWPTAPKALRTAVYLAMGWGALPLVPELAARLGGRGLLLLAGGGALYTVGAVIYATRRPDPFPRVFGYHEIFHALVVAAAALHFTVAMDVVRALGA
jgi:hemolysin III